MKKFTKNLLYFIFLWLFMGFFSLSANAQQDLFDTQTAVVTEKYMQFDFEEQFVVMVETDLVYNYYLLDFTKLTSDFQLVYFLDLLSKTDELGIPSHGISKKRSWIEVDKTYDEKYILKLINTLKQQTDDKDDSLNETDKANWIKNKYNLNK